MLFRSIGTDGRAGEMCSGEVTMDRYVKVGTYLMTFACYLLYIYRPNYSRALSNDIPSEISGDYIRNI